MHASRHHIRSFYMAIVHGRYDEAEAYFLKAIEICEDLDDEQVSLLRSLSFLYTEQKRFNEAKECVVSFGVF